MSVTAPFVATRPCSIQSFPQQIPIMICMYTKPSRETKLTRYPQMILKNLKRPNVAAVRLLPLVQLVVELQCTCIGGFKCPPFSKLLMSIWAAIYLWIPRRTLRALSLYNVLFGILLGQPLEYHIYIIYKLSLKIRIDLFEKIGPFNKCCYACNMYINISMYNQLPIFLELFVNYIFL